MNKEFEVHMLNEAGKRHANRIATLFNELLESLNSYIPEGRYASVMRTKLEEACFWICHYNLFRTEYFGHSTHLDSYKTRVLRGLSKFGIEVEIDEDSL